MEKNERLKEIDAIFYTSDRINIFGRNKRKRYILNCSLKNGEITSEECFKEKYSFGFTKKGRERIFLTEVYNLNRKKYELEENNNKIINNPIKSPKDL